MEHKTVLVVEDNEMNMKLVRRYSSSESIGYWMPGGGVKSAVDCFALK